ncbi:MAG: hypothetical protein DLM53_05790 [Candidatus Eremiobacter antarcticus]|nr:hypothetical protein [Candidatus Eremiobacteraeota bacterium]PZR62330.1 MAG: hypothetical protein DLM53_05790 [Candidatus Eremiobacter sp. RRmetagenome_bin22]
MISQELKNVLSAIESLSPQERQAVARLLQGDHTGLAQMGISPESINATGLGSLVASFAPGFLGQPGSNDGNTDSEPTSDAQERR